MNNKLNHDLLENVNRHSQYSKGESKRLKKLMGAISKKYRW